MSITPNREEQAGREMGKRLLAVATAAALLAPSVQPAPAGAVPANGATGDASSNRRVEPNAKKAPATAAEAKAQLDAAQKTADDAQRAYDVAAAAAAEANGAYDDAYVAARSIDDARIEQREVDQTYTADMTDPDNGISGLAARKVWRSIPSQLLRSSTKKFKYSEVERGGRRAKLIEPLDWLEAAGIISINALTDCAEAPLVPYDDTEGSFSKVYLSDTGLMFYKFGLNPRLWLESQEQGRPLGSSDFGGALAENSVLQALRSNDLQTYVCVLSRTP